MMNSSRSQPNCLGSSRKRESVCQGFLKIGIDDGWGGVGAIYCVYVGYICGRGVKTGVAVCGVYVGVGWGTSVMIQSPVISSPFPV